MILQDHRRISIRYRPTFTKFTKRKYFFKQQNFIFTSIFLLYFLSNFKVNAFQFLDDPVRNNRIHQVKHLAGETALLPCEVRTSECGSIYFITWSRNTSSEWHRIFIYSKTSQKAFYDKYNQIIGRPNHYNNQTQKLSFDATNLTSDGFAYLKIDSIDDNDAGMFRCDVTYVKGKCPSLTYTQLSTIIKPGKPEIKVNGIELNNDQDSMQDTFRLNGGSKHRRLAFEEGTTMTLECSTTGGKPVPFIRMFNGTRPLPGKVSLSMDETNTKQKVTSITQFVLSRYDLNSRFYCKVWTNISSMQPLFTEVSIDVHVKPTKLNIIRPPTPVVANEMVSLTCTVDGARPRSSITWFNKSQPVQQSPVENTELMDDGTYRTSSTLVFIATRFDHQSEFFCKGTNDVLKSKNEVPLLQSTQLQVLYPPSVSIEPSDSLDVNENQSASLLCKWSSNPTNLSELYFTFTPFSDPSNQPTPIAGVASPPFVLNKNLQFSRNAQFSILQNGVAELILSNLNRNQSGLYSCATRNAFGRATPQRPLQINIQYPPVVSIELLPGTALSESGNSLKLRCVVLTGQPRRLLKVHWFRNGNHFASTPNYYYTSTNDDLNEEINELQLNNLTEITLQANYSCSGYNGINRFGPISSPKALNQIISSSTHSYSNGNSLIYAVKDSSIKLNCTQLNSKNNYQTTNLKNTPSLTKWWFNGEVISAADNEPGSNSLVIERITSSNEGNYTCEQFGDARSSTYLKVQAPPRLVTGLPAYITWPTRNRSLTLSCRVECEPKCIISWLINNRTLSNDYRTSIAEIAQPAEGELLASTVSYLRINDAQLLQPETEIMCRGESNNIGNSVQSISIFKTEAVANSIQTSTTQMYYRPECNVRKELLTNGKILLSCTANGLPNLFNYTWLKQNQSLISNTEQQKDNAILVISETDQTSVSQYKCIVTNAVGNSEPCYWSLNNNLNNTYLNSEESILPNFLYKSDYLLVFAITSGILGFLLVCILIVCTVYFILRKRIKAVDNVGSKTLNLPAGTTCATYGLINSELMARTLNTKFNNYNNTENINYGKTSTMVKNYSEEQCKLALFDDEEKSITDGRSSDYHTYCDADTVRMSSTTKLFHPQQQTQLNKYSSNNKIYNSKMSSTSGHTNSNNSTSPLISRGQQLLLSSNEEDEDEDNSQMQLSTKRPSCSSQLTNTSNHTTSIHTTTTNNFINSNRSSLTNTTLYNNQPYSQTESQPNYYGQVIAPSGTVNRFLERQTNYRPQSNLGHSFNTLNNNNNKAIIEQDHHYYEPMFSNNKIYQKQPDLPPLPPERNHHLNNFPLSTDTNLRSSINGNFATLHHPQQHYLLSNSVQPPHMANYNTLNLSKHTVISNLTGSSTNLQHLNQFYSKKKFQR